MSSILLKSARIGLTNLNQDHYLRAHALNMNPEDVNTLLLNKLGSTGQVAPGTLTEIANRSGGVASTNSDYAYIENGWAVSRGLGYLEFVVTGESPIQSTVIGVYGYLHGGSDVGIGMSLTPDIMFVPVKSWVVESQAVADHTGFPAIKNMLTSADNILLGNPLSQEAGLQTIRPIDIVNTASGYATIDEENRFMSGETPAFGGSAGAMFNSAGVILSKADNDSTANYASSVIGAAASSIIETQNTGDPFTGIAHAAGLRSLRETPMHENLFFRVMRNSLGIATLTGFQGFSLGEISQVFSNFGEVTDTTLTNASVYDTEDNRVSTNEHTGSSFQVMYLTELNHLCNSIMQKYRLNTLHFRADNNVDTGQININGVPVGYQAGAAMPIMSNDPDFESNTFLAIEELISIFYAKHNSPYFHERTQAAIDCDASLFGETRLTIMLHGDQNTTRTQVFGTFAGNRFDPVVVTENEMSNTTGAFYKNLKEFTGY